MRTLLVVLCALAAQRGPAVPVQTAPASVHARTVPLSDLRANPAQFLGEEVVCALQFKALVEDWEPYLSRFEPARYLALEAWPDEGFTWDEPTFAHPFAHLYLRRGGGFEPLARRAHAYQRLEARVKVREVFLGEPWLELVELTPLDGEVGEGALLHMTRARQLAAEQQFELAVDQYERVKASPLPPHALAVVLAEIAAAQQAAAAKKRDEPAQRSP